MRLEIAASGTLKRCEQPFGSLRVSQQVGRLGDRVLVVFGEEDCVAILRHNLDRGVVIVDLPDEPEQVSSSVGGSDGRHEQPPSSGTERRTTLNTLPLPSDDRERPQFDGTLERFPAYGAGCSMR